MVLTGSKAEEQLTEILRNKENQKESEKFIVLKKPTSPPTFILFYGEYPTVTSASHARDKLLPTLQKYAPYPISVKQAVKKISGK
jgi:septal ring-binding cell division protein DamX